MKTVVYTRQSVVDLAVQSGQLDGLWNICDDNGMSPTEVLSPCSSIELPITSKYVNKLALGSRPATELTAADNEAVTSGGIGFMTIGTTFTVK